MPRDLDWRPLRPNRGDWPSSNPTTQVGDTLPLIPAAYIRNEHLAFGISPTKFAGIGTKVYRSTTQAITTGTNTACVYDTEAFDTMDGWSSADTDAIHVSHQGVYVITASVGWAASATGGERKARIEIDGTELVGDVKPPVTTASTATRHAVTAVERLAAGAVVRILVEHDVGANLNVQSGEGANSLAVIFLFPI